MISGTSLVETGFWGEFWQTNMNLVLILIETHVGPIVVVKYEVGSSLAEQYLMKSIKLGRKSGLTVSKYVKLRSRIEGSILVYLMPTSGVKSLPSYKSTSAKSRSRHRTPSVSPSVRPSIRLWDDPTLRLTIRPTIRPSDPGLPAHGCLTEESQ